MWKPIELTYFHQSLCIDVGAGHIAERGRMLRAEYEALPWWAWVRRLRLRHRLRLVTIVQDAYEIGRFHLEHGNAK